MGPQHLVGVRHRVLLLREDNPVFAQPCGINRDGPGPGIGHPDLRDRRMGLANGAPPTDRINRSVGDAVYHDALPLRSGTLQRLFDTFHGLIPRGLVR